MNDGDTLADTAPAVTARSTLVVLQLKAPGEKARNLVRSTSTKGVRAKPASICKEALT